MAALMEGRAATHRVVEIRDYGPQAQIYEIKG